MALRQSALSEPLSAFGAGDGGDLGRDPVRAAMQDRTSLSARSTPVPCLIIFDAGYVLEVVP